MPTYIDRREFLRAAGLGAGALALRGCIAAEDEAEAPASKGRWPAGALRPPNFVVIFADDQGYQDVGCFGSPDIRTPNLDRMAAEGMRFTDFYTAAPACSPARAGLMTGCYPTRVNVPRVLLPSSARGLNPRETTIADLLRSRGYATKCIGKWHLGHRERLLPTRHGFDSYFGIPYSNDMWIAEEMPIAADVVLREGVTRGTLWKNRKKKVPLMRDAEVIEYPCDQATLTQRYTEEAIRFIEANRTQPFLLYIPHTMPHVPLHPSERFRGRSPRGAYGDVIEELDWSVGEVLGAVKRLGLDERTLIVYTSDNGPWLSKRRRGGSARPLRRGKGTTYEGGMREPCIVRWPGRVPAGSVCGEVASTIDLLPTFAALAGAEVPAGRVIDGRNVAPLILGEPGARSPHEAFFYYRGVALEAVRAGRWKLRVTRPKWRLVGGKATPPPTANPRVELYDLAEDVGERRNLAADRPGAVRGLRELMRDFDGDLRADAESRPAGRA